jgi:hypothetical protein
MAIGWATDDSDTLFVSLYSSLLNGGVWSASRPARCAHGEMISCIHWIEGYKSSINFSE